MIDEGRARELLGSAGQEVPVGAAPVEALVRRGRRSLWQRRAAPAFAVAVVGVVVLASRGLGAPTAGPGPAEPADSDPGLVLNTSGWEPGDDAMRALGGGVVAVSAAGCVHIGAGDSRSDIVWPAGYTATMEPDGRVVVRRPDGNVVAAEGAAFEAGGGEAGAMTDWACRAPNSRGAFVIQEVMAPIEDVKIPDLVGHSQWQAEEVLAEAELDVGIIHDPSAITPGVELGTVVRQDPVVGFRTEPFDRVTLWVAAPDPEANETDRALAAAMVSFATGSATPAVSFADEVVLAYGAGEQRTVSREDALAGDESWVFEPTPAGPRVSILDALRSVQDEYSLWVGPHRRCADPPMPPPDQLGDLRQLSIQPRDTANCADWFAVDLYADERGEVAGVVLDPSES